MDLFDMSDSEYSKTCKVIESFRLAQETFYAFCAIPTLKEAGLAEAFGKAKSENFYSCKGVSWWTLDFWAMDEAITELLEKDKELGHLLGALILTLRKCKAENFGYDAYKEPQIS